MTRDKVLSGTLWSVLGYAVHSVATFAVFLLLARFLDAHDFGLVALASACVGFIEMLLVNGFHDALVQKFDATDEDFDTAFWASLGLGGLLALGLAAGAGSIAAGFEEPQLAGIISALSLVIPLSAIVALLGAHLTRGLSFKQIALSRSVASLAGGAVGVAMAVLGAGAWSLVGQQLALWFVHLGLLVVGCRWRPRLRFSWRRLGNLLRFAQFVVASSVTGYVSQRSDIFFLGAFLGPAAVGIYTVGQRIMMLLVEAITGATSRVALPAFSTLQREPWRLAAAFSKSVQFTSMITFPMFIGLACVAPDVTSVLLTDTWSAATPIIQVFAAVGLAQSVGYFHHTLLIAMGRPHWQMALDVFVALSNVLLLFAFVRYGVLATAVALLLRTYATYPLLIWMAKRLIPITVRGYLTNIARPLAAASLMGLAVLVVRASLDGFPDAARLACSVGIGVVVYPAALFALDRSLAAESLATIRTTMARPSPG